MSWNRSRVLVYRQALVGRTEANDVPPSSVEAPPDKIRVGIWDLDASAGALPRLLDRIDESQQRFSFSSVEAPFPTGLTTPGIGAAEDWLLYTGKLMNPKYAQFNVAARPIFESAKPVLEKLPIEWLVVMVKSMIADTTDPKSPWHNLFSTSLDKVILVSTYEVREYAAQAKRSFEAAVFGMSFSAVLAAIIPSVKYQTKSTGSIFDFCENRAEIAKSFRDPHIDSENRAHIPDKLLPAVDKILDILKEYKGEAALRKHKGKPAIPKKTHAWVKQSAGKQGTPAGARRSESKAAAFSSRSARSAKATSLKVPTTAAATFLTALNSLDATLSKMPTNTASTKSDARPKSSKRK